MGDKMLKFYFDSGTTNSRLYVLDDKNTIIYKSEKSVGSKDVSITGNKKLLAQELSGMYFEAKKILQYNGEDTVWMSGMVTSPNGILEVPHIEAPAGKEELAKNVSKNTKTQLMTIKKL